MALPKIRGNSMKTRIIFIILIVLVTLGLTGCERELPSSIDVKNYISNKFIGGYELEYVKKETDTKGYDISYYNVRLRNLYELRFKVTCSSKENISNLSGISDNFNDVLRDKYLKETPLEFNIESKGLYEYTVELENDISKYDSVCNIIRYLVHFESGYTRYKESFCKEYTISDFIYNSIVGRNNYRWLNNKIKIVINNENDEVELRLLDYAHLTYKESKERYENTYKILKDSMEDN